MADEAAPTATVLPVAQSGQERPRREATTIRTGRVGQSSPNAILGRTGRATAPASSRKTRLRLVVMPLSLQTLGAIPRHTFPIVNGRYGYNQTPTVRLVGKLARLIHLSRYHHERPGCEARGNRPKSRRAARFAVCIPSRSARRLRTRRETVPQDGQKAETSGRANRDHSHVGVAGTHSPQQTRTAPDWCGEVLVASR